MIRIRPEEFESIIATILYRIGNIPSPSIAPPGAALFHKYKGNPYSLDVFMDVMSRLPDFIMRGTEEAKRTGNKSIDPVLFLEESRRRHGQIGVTIASELLSDIIVSQQRNPWSDFRREEWRDIKQLEELFKSESLETQYGLFFDQRFIDYLAGNFHDINRINWRKFEGLTCEFFDRLGFHVEIGKGRDDNNIDARIWASSKDKDIPPTMLVQCKREKSHVGKIVVKALYADIISEGVDSGLIVTTSALSPGAKKVCTARGYPINEANRETLRKWLEIMRTPFTGVVMGE